MRHTRATLGFGALALLFACSNSASQDVVAEDDLIWDPISSALGNSPNFAQLGNGSLMSVVSREFGRGSKAGALVELFYPQYSEDNLWDSYVGVSTGGGRYRWSHQWQLAGQRIAPGASVIQTDFTDGALTLRLEDVVRPGANAHIRRATITNRGASAASKVSLAFYAYFTVGTLPGGDRVRYDAVNDSFLQSDGRIALALTADRKSSAVHCGNALQLVGARTDARIAVQRRQLQGCPSAIDAGIGGVNTSFTQALGDLAPQASVSVTYAIGAGSAEADALSIAKAALTGGFDARAAEDRAHWQAQLARAKSPALPARAAKVYERALIAILQHRVDNGAFIAAPTLTSPVYRFVWPRDGSKTAIDLLGAGYTNEAKTFFEFLEKRLLADGSFAVNYYPDGSKPLFDFGRDGNEHDQPGMLLWGVERVYLATKDQAWLAARYPAMRRAAQHLLEITGGPDAIIGPSRDLWELETDSSWTYAQASAIAGLEAIARSASVLGNSVDAAAYSARASAMRTALTSKLVAPGGYYARGIKSGKLDTRVEIANLAIGAGGFQLLPDSDPAVVRLGQEVAKRLMTPGGAVRRYEGDTYYGGQPWPVAAVWVAWHELALGNRAAAEKLFGVVTEQAYATDALLIGEQFDETNKQWLSSQPLVWSEAAYTRLARQLYPAP